MAGVLDGGPQDPDALRRFAEGGFRDWMNRLREAESLLPADLGVRQRLTGIREDLAGIGRDYYRKGAVPQYDLVFDRAIKPLTLSAEELSVLIRERKGDYGLSRWQGRRNSRAIPRPRCRVF